LRRAFIFLAIGVALASVGLAWRGWPALERTFESSSQLAVRHCVRPRRAQLGDGHMRDSTAAALVGAAMLSTLVYPFIALALRRGAEGSGNPVVSGVA
jgi:hypothetical protein